MNIDHAPSRGRTARVPVLQRQRGIALATALIILILVTLIGLAAIRGATTQQRMTANFYDRELAFQNAEAALRSAEALLLSASPLDSSDYRDCIVAGGVGTPCAANPFMDEDSAGVAAKLKTVSDYSAGSNAPGQPQFIVERMCTNCSTASDPSQCQSANCQSYGTQSSETSVWYYRVTARSGDPQSDAGTGRAVVVLQAMFAVPAP